MRSVGGNDDQKIKPLTDALVQVMKETTFVLDDPHIDLAKAPTDVKLTALRDTVEQKLNAAIGNNPANLDPNDIKTALQKVLTP